MTQLVTGFVSAAAAVRAGLIAGAHSERAETIARFAGGLSPYHDDFY